VREDKAVLRQNDCNNATAVIMPPVAAPRLDFHGGADVQGFR